MSQSLPEFLVRQKRVEKNKDCGREDDFEDSQIKVDSQGNQGQGEKERSEKKSC
jgi:hypothetical protein